MTTRSTGGPVIGCWGGQAWIACIPAAQASMSKTAHSEKWATSALTVARAGSTSRAALPGTHSPSSASKVNSHNRSAGVSANRAGS